MSMGQASGVATSGACAIAVLPAGTTGSTMRRLITCTCGAGAARRIRATEAARHRLVQATVRIEGRSVTSTPGIRWQVSAFLTILSDWIVSFSSWGMCLSC